MKNILKYRALLFVCLISLVGFAITSCNDDDELDTSQMGSSKITLKSYGPSPALRGSEIRFIGDNVDKVTAVTIPGAGDVTEFTKKEKTEIRLIVPQNAEVGYPVLKTPEGEITAITLLTFEEPISISSITAAKTKAGSKFTIEGDYLNLIAEVIFAENAVVEQENFVSQDRKKIEVIVPVEAQSGKIIVSNGAEIPIEVYSDTEANIVAPTVSGISPTTVKPGTEIKIAGTDLDLMGSIVFAGGVTLELTDPELNGDFSELTATVPFEAPDGKITVVAKSGLEFPFETELTMIIPTNLAATPNSGLIAGGIITITGADLDLVTNITFPNVEKPAELISQSNTQITVAVPVFNPIPPDEEGGEPTIPEGARSGDLLLNMANGKTAEIAFKMLQPTVENYNPNPVTAGSELTITGINMDLVKAVTFTGDVTSEPSSVNSTQVVVRVPVDAVTGPVTLILTNGEPVEYASVDIISPVFCFIPELPAPDVEILGGTILSIEVVNGDKLIDVKINENSTQFILRRSTLNILIPSSSSGATEFTLVSSNGEVSYTINITPNTTETVIMDTETDLGSWSASFRLYKEQFQAAGFKAGSVLRLYTTPYGDWPQIQINHANWGALIMPEGSDVTEITDIVFSQEMVYTMMSQDDGWSTTALVIQGAGAIIHKVSVIVEN